MKADPVHSAREPMARGNWRKRSTNRSPAWAPPHADDAKQRSAVTTRNGAMLRDNIKQAARRARHSSTSASNVSHFHAILARDAASASHTDKERGGLLQGKARRAFITSTPLIICYHIIPERFRVWILYRQTTSLLWQYQGPLGKGWV